jgi:hypothetical protein
MKRTTPRPSPNRAVVVSSDLTALLYSMGVSEDNPIEISDEDWDRHWDRFATRPFFRLWNPEKRGSAGR